ncbi:MAG TPA: flagellar basal body P-ring protein FlgI [Gemmatimonadaceae bacterium]|nr:flagellar basal body P-ring protein FlgI [Gemmatimonadaceae bacterium]
MRRIVIFAIGLLLQSLVPNPHSLLSQESRIADLTVEEKAVPVRLVGYGIVAGLDGTGDRGLGGRSGGMTVQSVANLLRRFNVEIPAEVLRTRNVAAVLVTAEVSPYLRAGGRFEVHVSSLGDARSLRGGVLWVTPLVADPNGPALATAQGAMLVSDGDQGRYRVVNAAVNSGRIPQGGIVEGDLPRPSFAAVARLVLREPDLGTASRVAQAINAALGAGSAKIEDPGSVQLALKGSEEEKATALGRIRDLRIRPDRRAVLVIDARSGTIVAGGDLPVSEASVSRGGITITVGPLAPAATAPADSSASADSAGASGVARGASSDSSASQVPASEPPPRPTPNTPRPASPIRLAAGAQVADIAAALHAIQAPASDVAAIFAALRDAGAIAAELVVR